LGRSRQHNSALMLLIWSAPSTNYRPRTTTCNFEPGTTDHWKLGSLKVVWK